MDNEDYTVNPGDSISNKGSANIKDALLEIQEIEKEKSRGKEKTPIPQSIIFTIFGIITCFLSYIETSIMSSLLFSFKNRNIDKSKLFFEVIKYMSLFIISLIIIKFKIKRPCWHQLILSFLFCFISYSSSYLYSRNIQSFILLSKVFCILFVSIFFGINNLLKIRKFQKIKLPNLIWYGLLLALFGILIEFISSYYITIHNGEDNIRFIYHYNDYPNFFLSLSNGICYAAIIFLFDCYCTSLENIFYTLFYVGLFSGIICFLLSLCYSELFKIKQTFEQISDIQINYFIVSVCLYLFNIILLSILIKRCSKYSAGIMISAQMPIRVIVDIIKYQNSKSNIFTIISLLLCIGGLFIICYYHISNNYNQKVKMELNKVESFASDTNKKFALINPDE